MPLPIRRWLSRGAEVMEAKLLAQADADWHCDVLIVGSGYGGAVAAARLAGCIEADGRSSRVWVLERGQEHLPGSFPSRWAELPGQVRLSMQDGKPPRGVAEGLYDIRVGPDAAVLLGNGLGGGSLINAGVMVEPDEAVFDEHWPEALRCTGGQRPLAQAFASARAMLRPSKVARSDLTPKFKALEALVRDPHSPEVPDLRAEVTINTGPAPQQPEHGDEGVPLAPCTRCGDCLTGCNIGAKGSLDTNYLWRAASHGARLFTGGTVRALRQRPDPKGGIGGWEVHWRYTSSTLQGRQRVGTLFARRVVLAAGALGSTEILARSAEAGLPLSPTVGQRAWLNGDALFAGVAHPEPVRAVADPEADPHDDAARQVGPTITGSATVPLPQGGTARIQDFAVPGALRQAFGEITTSRRFFANAGEVKEAQWARALGVADPLAVNDRALERTSLFGAMVDEATPSRWTLPAATAHGEWDGLRIESPRIDDQLVKWPALEALRAVLQARRSALGDHLPLLWADTPFDRQLPRVTVHPLGGCAMADDAAQGVVNDCGLVFCGTSGPGVHPALAVLDGAIVTRALGANPALTIAALAERAVALLKTHPAWPKPPQDRTQPIMPTERPLHRRDELAPAAAVWRLEERLHGPCTLDNQRWWARLDLEFEPIPGWRRVLQMQARAMTVQRGRLRLYGPIPPEADAFEYDIESDLPQMAAQAEVAGSMALVFHAGDTATGERADGTRAVVSLQYRLALTGVAVTHPTLNLPSLRAGVRLSSSKTLPLTPDAACDRASLLRLLSTLPEVRLEGRAIGTWVLDLGELAERQGALMALTRASNLPDAIDDVAAVLGYGVRAATGYPWVAELANSRPLVPAEVLAAARERLPVRYRLGGNAATVEQAIAPSGAPTWRLTRWKGPGRPVMLIHGLGVSGAMFSHPGIGMNLARFLHEPPGNPAGEDEDVAGPGLQARDVWVLDLSSSTGLATGRREELVKETVQQVARRDIPQAIESIARKIREERPDAAPQDAVPIDVIAHCMGGVQFLLAVLGDDEAGSPQHWRRHVRSAVISQTGPVLRLGAANRLRGALANALRPWWGTPWLHAVPETDDQPADALPQDDEPATLKLAQRLFDAAASQFPHGDDDAFCDGLRRHGVAQHVWEDLRRIRRRADLIFGQLFEAHAMAPAALAALPALFGPVPLKMLAEALNFMRHDMLTEQDGRNAALSASRVRQRLNFPVLLVHGRRNRVFHWRGSLRGGKWLAELAGLDSAKVVDTSQVEGLRHWQWAQGRIQVAVWKQHGHLDTMMGESAHRSVFPMVRHFIDQAWQPPERKKPGKYVVEPPWLGPMLGGVERLAGGHPLRVRVVLHPSQRRTGCQGLVAVPMRAVGAGWQPDLDRARWLPWPGQHAHHWPADRPPPQARAAALALDINPTLLGDPGHRLAVLTVHRDEVAQWVRARPMPMDGVDWLKGGRPLIAPLREVVPQRLAEGVDPLGQMKLLPLTLPQQVLDAADVGQAARRATPLRLALASCQYPPQLLDGAPAQASMHRLLEEARQGDGPQLLLLAGDQVYVDADAGLAAMPTGGPESDVDTQRALMDHAYERTWALPAWRALMARLPAWPMLDDHEVRDDWQGTADPRTMQVDEALAAYERFQGLLAWGRPLIKDSRSRVAYPGGVPVCVLDTRSRRSPRSAANLDHSTIVPAEELEALLTWLKRQPQAAYKLLLTPVPLLPPETAAGIDPSDSGVAHALRADTWAGFPASAQAFLDGVRRYRIRRLVLLAGDSHLSSVSTLHLPGHPDPLLSIVASGLYAPWPFANQRPAELAPDGDVAFGPAGRRITARLRTLALMREDGFARIDLEPGEDGAASVHVRLCASDGRATSTRIRFEPISRPAARPRSTPLPRRPS